MAKRFIDTGLFDDGWFMDLSKEGKILWMYFLTKCDHAGMLRLNEKLCKVQTDINSIDTVIKELGNRLVTVNEHLYFIPKFIVYQYPGFPNSKARAQQSAMEILKKYNLLDENNLTVTQLLPNSPSKGKDNSNDSNEVKGEYEGKEKIHPTRKERNEKYLPLAEYLSKIIQSNKNIKHTSRQLFSWADNIRQLEENDGISYDRINNALIWYEKHIGEDYVVEIESGSSLKDKFIRLETASKKTNTFKRKVDPEKIIRYGEDWFLQSDGKYRNSEGTLFKD